MRSISNNKLTKSLLTVSRRYGIFTPEFMAQAREVCAWVGLIIILLSLYAAITFAELMHGSWVR